MDVTAVDIKLHPLAIEYLFKHYAVLRRIFSDVLGQLETDYVSIGLIDRTGQLILLSSKPSIEQNLIDKNLLEHDGSFQSAFVFQDKPSLWTDLYNPEHKHLLYQYKQTAPGLEEGIAIPANFAEYRAIFSFGFKLFSPLIHNQLEKLLAIGKFSLREIIKTIPLPPQQRVYQSKPHLKLIINNQVTI
ncbi:MAG: flagellar biosynthesis protein FlgJ [Legionella sp.]|jgi:hypothetical protein